MSETAFVVYLDEAQENRYRHWHVWDGAHITAFRIQYETRIAGRWHPIVRYDSAHEQPHRDLLHPDDTQTKEVYPQYHYADILTLGQRDIIEHWQAYRSAYLKEMGA